MLGNAFKYVWRHAEKNGNEDLRKAAVYLRWALEDGDVAVCQHPDDVRALFEVHVLPFIDPSSVYGALGEICTSQYGNALARVENCLSVPALALHGAPIAAVRGLS
ncbi:DUF3310 domain-containing protein [Nocardia sp. NPDC004123]